MSYDLTFYRLAPGQSFQNAMDEEELSLSEPDPARTRVTTTPLTPDALAQLCNAVEHALAPCERFEGDGLVEFTASDSPMQCTIRQASASMSWPMSVAKADVQALRDRVQSLIQLFSTSALSGYDRQLGRAVTLEDADERMRLTSWGGQQLDSVLRKPWWKFW